MFLNDRVLENEPYSASPKAYIRLIIQIFKLLAIKF